MPFQDRRDGRLATARTAADFRAATGTGERPGNGCTDLIGAGRADGAGSHRPYSAARF
ncbi:hypothetical protein [Streptomyces sp. NPDC059378]|uniref:hypothetical protein n=1 Tax=Streptomyces sp. NPDC059378 TaxID=3346815 RepID=UPI00369F2973